MSGFTKKNINKYYNYLIKENKNDKKMLYEINPKFKNQESKLLELFGKYDNMNKKIKIVLITDTHGCLKEDKFKHFILNINEYDICLLLGDHSIGDVNLILKYIKKKKYMLCLETMIIII